MKNFRSHKKRSEMEDKCIMCGEYVPEGRMVCEKCESEINSREEKEKKDEGKNSKRKRIHVGRH